MNTGRGANCELCPRARTWRILSTSFGSTDSFCWQSLMNMGRGAPRPIFNTRGDPTAAIPLPLLRAVAQAAANGAEAACCPPRGARGGGAGRIALPPSPVDPPRLPEDGLESAVSAWRLLKIKARAVSRAAGGVTRKCCATLRRRASRCLLLAAHCCRAASRSRSTVSSSSDHASSPSFRRPLHGLCGSRPPRSQ